VTEISSGATCTDNEINDQFSSKTQEELEVYFNSLLEEANQLSNDISTNTDQILQNKERDLGFLLNENAEELRWFVYPFEVTEALLQKSEVAVGTLASDKQVYGPVQPHAIGINLPNCATTGQEIARLPGNNSHKNNGSLLVDGNLSAVLSPVSGKVIKFPYRSAHSDLLELPVWAQRNVVKSMIPMAEHGDEETEDNNQ
jgi:hypothetical protein